MEWWNVLIPLISLTSLAQMTSVSLVNLCADKYIFEQFLLGTASAPPFLAVTVTELNEAGCTLDVSWSEPAIRCGGSVSQYVLTVTPPTSDCQSSGDCMVMDGSSVITTPGTVTQYSLTVTSQDYDITVRADTCGGSLTGDTSSLYNINLTGENY